MTTPDPKPSFEDLSEDLPEDLPEDLSEGSSEDPPEPVFRSAPAPPDGVVPTGSLPLDYQRFRDEPLDLYRELRRDHGPVVPVLLDGKIPVWAVLGYREVVRVTTDPRLFARDPRRWHAWHLVPPDWELMTFVGYRPTMLFSEGAEHQRRAEAIWDGLASVDQFELRAQCERVADRLIDTFAGSGRADLVAEYASQIPLRVVTRLYGLDDAESAAIQDDSLHLTGPDAPLALRNMQTRTEALIKRVRENPDQVNVAAHLVAHPAGLTDDEIVNDLLGSVYAVQQPTSDLIGNALRLMLTDERFAITLSGGRRSVGQALNEVLWEDTPVPFWIGRWAAEDTMLGGRRIRKGDCLMLGLAAANADPDVRPDFHSGAGGNQAHMAFSHGKHGCPPAAREIAQVIAGAAVEVLLDRLPDVALSVAPDDLEWRVTLMMRGVAALPVRFTPAHLH
ncbi:cytochrome P450 [Streptomyces sp. NEAU-YJ-81]|uniref:cytochrome P450 n=1 Tax=Streptomyces sp. NEAU-YJ-81 TaxID=2820288 RepID=UPI001ABCB561|nr:cytochrome P450 [Streptomyces sp. NEAU-YJ-81]MBO3673650.1 cytochrome P450 [Streptomyces sp. NEAU-YJ-81]